MAGQNLQYSLLVHDNGPSDEVGTPTVTDQLPTHLTFVSATGPGWTCDYTDATRTVSCTGAADLAAGADADPITLTVTVDHDAPSGATITNTAHVDATAASPDPDLTNNDGSDDIGVGVTSEVTLTKKLDTATPVVAGTDATFTLTATNSGPSDATDVTVTDTLPQYLSYASADGAGWTCGNTGQVVACTRPVLSAAAPDNAATITLVAHTDPATPVDADGKYTAQNIAAVATGSSGPTHDPAPVDVPMIAQADLTLHKSVTDPDTTAGADVTWTFDVLNNGPSDAAGPITIVDTLPGYETYTSASGLDWTCVPGAAPSPPSAGSQQTVTCTLAHGIASGAHDDALQLTAHVVSAAPDGTQTNFAAVSSPTPDPVPGDDNDTADVSVGLAADLSITKTHTGTPVAGENLQYTLQVHNAGTSDEHGSPTVTDQLPAHLTFVSAAGTGWTCDYADATRTVTCTGATDLVAGADADPITLTVTVDHDAPAGATITNTATVDGTAVSPDPDLTGNTASDDITVTTRADVTLTKTLDTTAPVVAGTDATFTLTVADTGPSDATDVTVTDTLPLYLSYVSATGDGWSCDHDGAVITCTRPVLTAGLSGAAIPAITVVAHVDPATPITPADGTTTLQNTAAVTTTTPGTTHDPDPVPVPVVGRADLALTKSVTDPAATAGRDVTWTFDVVNNGPSDAEGDITVVDTLPGYQTYGSAVGTDWTCTAGPAPAPPSAGSHQTVTCTHAGGLAVGLHLSDLRITAHVASGAPDGTQTNSATVSSATPDPTPGDDTGTATVTVGRSGALHIVKSHTGDGVVGKHLVFTLAVSNDGPSDVDDVVVSDPLPAGLGFVSATGTGWTCTGAGGTLTCRLAGSVAAGTSAAPITLVTLVQPHAYPTVTNTATVRSTDPDFPGTDQSSDPITVDPSAQLAISKHHQGKLVVGEDARYTIKVTDRGPTDSPGPIVVTDRLPAGLAYGAATGPGWVCAAHVDTMTCTHADPLPLGRSSVITVDVHVLAAAYPRVRNSATATGPGSTAVTGTDVAPVVPLTHLRLVKRLAGYHGDEADYTITLHNDGPNPTGAPATITDRLPAGLSYLSADGAGWTCGASGATVSCRHPASIGDGESAGITLRTRVTATTGSHVRNVAHAIAAGGGTGIDSNPVTIVVSGPQGSAGGGSTPADTGAQVLAALRLALVLLLVGGAAVVLGRRRRRGTAG